MVLEDRQADFPGQQRHGEALRSPRSKICGRATGY